MAGSRATRGVIMALISPSNPQIKKVVLTKPKPKTHSPLDERHIQKKRNSLGAPGWLSC